MAADIQAQVAMDPADVHHHHRHRQNGMVIPHAQEDVDDVLLAKQKQPTAAEIALARARLASRLASHGATPATTLNDAVSGDMDVLARATASFRVLLQRASAVLEACQRSHYYSVLSQTTQPAHIVTFLSVALIAALLFPRQGAQDGNSQSQDNPHRVDEPSSWTYLTYVVSFAAHFGSQFWMTFVSGLSLFFSLPRHHFAEVQKVLFPLYFGINAALSLLTLGTFVRMQHGSQHQWDAEVIVQVGSMVLCFLLELLVRLYLTPPLLRLITAKTDMEKTVAGVGQEVGRYDLGPLTQCPHYVKIHRAFRKVHAGIALANIAAMGCTALHAHYLAGKICI